MDDTEKLKAFKIEIRSILLPFQKGCYLTEFNRTYFELIGKRLPFKEMGYARDIDFLYSMPDVVRITETRGAYHLMGVADDKSKHIQKMVAKQKPAKLKGPPLRSTRSFRFESSLPPRSLPPRFSRVRQVNDSSLRYPTYSKEPEKPPITLPKEEPKLRKEEPKLRKEEPKLRKEESKLHMEESKLPYKSSPMEEVIALVQHLKKLAVDDVLCEYKRMYNKNLSLSTYGFSSIEECLTEIPELQVVLKNNVKFVILSPENQNTSINTGEEEVYLVLDECSSKIPPPEVPSFNTYKQNCDNGNIPTSLEDKLLKVAESCTSGILASDFPRCFEEVTGHTLDFVNLGYRCLMDFIDDVPDIFFRTPIVGSKKDYRIYPAKGFMLKGNPDDYSPLKRITLNLRRILVAYPEGIKLPELINAYSINCKESLHVKEFGFDDLEKFLASVQSDVPLRFGSINGIKTVHLVKLSEIPAADPHYVDPKVYNQEAIPFDAVFPEFKYKPHTFPDDFDFSIYIPAYASSIANAGHLYLQFQEDFGCSDELAKLGTEIDQFYNGSESELYTMKTIHIAVGVSCIAKWPADDHWYRAQITSIPSMQTVKVCYVDYGTTDTIPKFLLRYAKSEFIGLPAQAVRCRLAFLKPPNNASKWNIETRNRILQLCQDVPLMAKIDEIGPDGVYSVLLCDTNGDDDVYINDVLIKEGLAETFTEPEPSESSPKKPEPLPYLHPLHALQAQYFLQAFAATAPMFAQNELYLGLLKEVTALCRNNDPVSQSASIPLVPPVVPPGFNSFSQGLHSFPNPSAFHTAYPNAASTTGANLVKKSKANTIPPPKGFYSASIESPSSALLSSPVTLPEENGDIENEIFDDDDDEMFQQFCQKVSLTNFHHVKRVMLGDGYKIHIIVLDSLPYASSGEISQLIWNNKEADYLITRLQLKEVDIPVKMLSEDGHEQLFQQLLKFNVKGVQKTNGFKSSIVLYTLRDVMKILNIFGHPSVTLRTKLNEEISTFNPNDRCWRDDDEFCVDSDPEDEDSLSAIVYSSATDDDKIEKLCLYDLLAMKESIVHKRKKMLSSSDLCNSTDEFDKLEKLLKKVMTRIQEIREICEVFS